MSSPQINNNNPQNEYQSPEVHAMYVCDHPEYFYTHIEQICRNIGLSTSSPATTTSDTSDTSDSSLVSSTDTHPKTVTTPVALSATDSTRNSSAVDDVAYIGDPRTWLHMHYGVGI